jgi:hypothetical protein
MEAVGTFTGWSLDSSDMTYPGVSNCQTIAMTTENTKGLTSLIPKLAIGHNFSQLCPVTIVRACLS